MTAPLDLRAVEARLEQGPAWIAEILKQHLPTRIEEKRLTRCACELEFHFVDAKVWHRHAAAMIWNAAQEDALLAHVRALRAALEPFARHESSMTGGPDGEATAFASHYIAPGKRVSTDYTLGDLMRAAAVLAMRAAAVLAQAVDG
jgi:hypothetical protein